MNIGWVIAAHSHFLYIRRRRNSGDGGGGGSFQSHFSPL